jgi:SAM-dependent methyltransferase
MLVRDQYEENPYPRWVKAPVSTRRQHLDLFLRLNFPTASFRSLGKAGAVDMLVAGCGTGQQLLGLAQTITGARTLAVDLSLASLCYAQRQTEALGLRNIEFGQADILDLGGLDRSFDVIECSGVLHHLGDPEAGWRVLVSLLRPGGFMRIALYSELARSHVVAARKLIAERGAGRTADDIRRFRQELLADSNSALAHDMAASLDFFGISTCRDLLFHVQEHRFTVPRIKSFLTSNDLQFIGFEVPQPVRRRYAEWFPEDSEINNLDNWHTFEQEHRRTFIGMYQFWVQKGAGEPTGRRRVATAALA